MCEIFLRIAEMAIRRTVVVRIAFAVNESRQHYKSGFLAQNVPVSKT